MKRTAAALLVLGAVLAVSAPPAAAGGGCHLPQRVLTERAATTITTTKGVCWSPGAAVVPVGATVTFRNPRGGLQHNLSGPGIVFTSLDPGTTHRVTFDAAGYYPFQCTIHLGMAGVVIARDLAPDPAVTPVAAAGDTGGGGGSVLPWAAGVAAVGAIGLVAFVRRSRGVPVPAR